MSFQSFEAITFEKPIQSVRKRSKKDSRFRWAGAHSAVLTGDLATFDSCRDWGTIQRVLRRSAASLCQFRPVCKHGLVFFQPVERLPENLSCPDVRRHYDSIVHPLAFATRCDDASVPQIREVARYLRLRAAQYLHEVTDAYFLISHEVE